MNGTEILQPVQWLLAPLKPLLYWSAVSEAWLMATALNCIVLVSGLGKALKWGGEHGHDWRLIVASAALAVAYGCAEYLPSGVTTVAGAALVFTFSSIVLKVSGMIGRGGALVAEATGIVKPTGTLDRGPSKPGE
jgi:hypothetical protein